MTAQTQRLESEPALSMVRAETSQLPSTSPPPQSSDALNRNRSFMVRLTGAIEKDIRPNGASVKDALLLACNLAEESDPPIDISLAAAFCAKVVEIHIKKGWKVPRDQLKHLANAETYRYPEYGEAVFQVDAANFRVAKARADRFAPVNLRIDLESMRESKRAFELVPIGDLLRDPKPTDWLVKGFIAMDTTTLLVGAPGCGKSFLALDLAGCITTGKDWNGRTVQEGLVVYLVGEGLGGIPKRAAAWEGHHGQSLAVAPLHVSKCAALLDVEEQVEAVRVAIRQATELTGLPVMAVITDTLARSFKGDENSTHDMGEFIRGHDTIRQEFGCAMVIVHHSGHGEETKMRARGSSALNGAVDMAFTLCKVASGKTGEPDKLVLHNTKNKEGEELEKMAFNLESVRLPDMWNDEEGEPSTSAVLVPCDPPSASKSRPLTPKQRAVLAASVEFMGTAGRAPRKAIMASFRASDLFDAKTCYDVLGQLLRDKQLVAIGPDILTLEAAVALVDEEAIAASFG